MRTTVSKAGRVPRIVRLEPIAGRANRAALAGSVVSGERLARRVAALGRRVAADYAGTELVVVGLLNGSVLFVADLIRRLPGPLAVDFVGVSSYRGATRPGRMEFTNKLRLDVRGRDVLLVDDILDTGRTLAAVRRRLEAMGAARVRICVLLDKPARREVEVVADYIGFRIPDWFVVGYGLDFEERWRNLPFIAVLRPSPSESAGTRVRPANP